MMDDERTIRSGGNATLRSSAASPLGELQPGQLFGRFRILHCLGAGGMGAVYQARDEALERDVAIKVVRPLGSAEDETTPKLIGRLQREARAAAAITHPNVVAVYEVGEADSLAFIVMECIRGKTLRALIGAPLATDEALRILTDVARALGAAHAKGIVHRDVKPENIMVAEDGTVKVLDFGIAKAFDAALREDNLTGEGLIVGSPRYMAPEQLRNEALDGRADQFAWAVVAYELLAGQPPWRSGTLAELMSDILRAPVPGTEALALRAGAGAAGAIVRALAKRPENRFATMAEVIEAMGASSEIARTNTSLSPMPASQGAGRRLHPVARTTMLLAMAAASVFAVVAYRKSARSQTSPVTAAQSTPAPAPSGNDGGSSADYLTVKQAAIDADIVTRCQPAARASLAAGLQLWRDASQWESLTRFDDAVQADPQCAVASLYYLIGATHTFPRRREHFRRARELRSNLNGRETKILNVMEPLFSEPPDYAESSRRAELLSTMYPDDTDVRRLHGRYLHRLGRLTEAAAVIAETAQRQTNPVPINEFLGALVAEKLRNDTDAAKHFDRCLLASPDSADCLYWQGLLAASQGQCTKAENSFRRLVAAMPRNADAHSALGEILLTSTGDPSAARGAFEERWRDMTGSNVSSEPPEVVRLADEFRMAVVTGDLKNAIVKVKSWNKAVASVNTGRFRAEPLLQWIEILREVGKQEDARALALEGLREHRAWTSDEKLDITIEFVRLAYLTGGISAAQFRVLRSEWIEQRKRPDIDVWMSAYAGLPVVGMEMNPPIEPGVYAQDWFSASPENYARIADEFTVQGRNDDAVRHARAAASSCLLFAPITGYLHARIALARAFDKANHRDDACRSYADVVRILERTPESVSLHLAKRRIKEMYCFEINRK